MILKWETPSKHTKSLRSSKTEIKFFRRQWNCRHSKELLDRKYEQYHQYGFVADDPISVPHRYALRQDIEITAFVTATIS